jgi:membrane-bound lytic murein transglycosylase D
MNMNNITRTLDRYKLKPKPKIRFNFIPAVLLLAFFMFLGIDPVQAGENFPEYPCLQSNVAFWKDVYTKYPTSSGIVHDNRDLSIVYGIIPLKDPHESNSSRINRSRIEAAKHKYRHILRQLARSRKSATRSPELKHVAALFGPETTSAQFQQASKRIRVQVGQRNRFKAGLIRSGAYLDHIRETFLSFGLPEELIYLPHVESSFNIEAYSKFGAAGLWQFTRSTGKRYMTIDYTLDERRDPLTATIAAAKLLKENYQKLGNWPLAVTAYNHGTAGMLRAKRRKGGYEAIFNSYRSRSFKFASRNFYSEFLAAKSVAQEYQNYFGDLASDSPQTTCSIKLDGYAAIDDLVVLFEVDRATIKRLNPALRRPVFQGLKHVPKGYTLRLPDTMAQKLFDQADGLLAGIYQKDQKHSHFYKVQQGDTAGRIARMHAVRLSDLILANNLDNRARIYVNQTLRLPQKNGANPRETTTGNSRTMPPAKEYPSPLLASIIPLPRKTTSKPAGIGASEELPAQELSRSVVCDPLLVAGDLMIKYGHPFTNRTRGTIVVAAEETLGHYAEWLGIRTMQLRRMNNLQFGQPIHTGQKIQIPLDKIGGEAFEEKRIEYHQRIQEDFFQAYVVENTLSYPVEQGDSIWIICNRKFQIPFWLIQKYNTSIDFTRLRTGQKLTIPVVADICDNGTDTPTTVRITPMPGGSMAKDDFWL